MKILAILFTFLFFTFLSTPTVVAMVKKNDAMDKYFSASEEEENSSNHLNEILFISNCEESNFLLLQIFKDTAKNNFSLIEKFVTVSRTIIIPPPKYTIV